MRTVARHPLAAPLAVGVVAVAAALYVHAVDPHEQGHYPTCPSLTLTGWYCPGCGSLRAVNAITHGSLAGAWDMNPALVIVAPWIVWRWVKWMLAASGRPVHTRPAPGWAIYVLAGGVVAYWVARNIGPTAGFLAP